MPPTETNYPLDGAITDLVARLTAEAEADRWIGMAETARLCGAETPSTSSRHSTKGIWTSDGRRVVLESLVIGGKRLTTRAAIARFLESQQPNPAASDSPTPPLPRSPAKRRRASEAAAAKADQLLA